MAGSRGLRPYFFKIVKLPPLRFLLQGDFFDRLKMLCCKVVEVVLELPDPGLAHLDDGLLVDALLVPGVLDVLLARALQELPGSFEEGGQQLGKRGS